jgi:type IV pilus assembly protein PilK
VPQDDDNYLVVQQLHQRLCFVQSNLQELETKPKMAMDVIYCQNVLIYFQPDCQFQVLNELVKHLKLGGLLVFGADEAAGWKHPHMYRSHDASVQAYVKNGPFGKNDQT